MSDRESKEKIEIRRKRLLFRAWHRGMREMDLILGRFADTELPGFNEKQLDVFETLLEMPDPELYNWITGSQPTPVEHETPLMAELRRFHLGKAGA